MEQNEIEMAITKGRLPLSISHKIIIAVCAIETIAAFILTYICKSPGPLLLLFISGLLIGKVIWQTKLAYSPSIISIDSKIQVLGKLIDTSDVSYVTKQENYFSFSMNGHWLTPDFKTIILYNETGYYINVTTGFGRSEWLAFDKPKQIINRIAQLEFEV